MATTATRTGGGEPGAKSIASTVSMLALALVASKAARTFAGPPDAARNRASVDGRSAPGRAGETAARRPAEAAREPGRGREAAAPTDIPARGWWDIAKRVYDEIGRDRILAVAAGVTFYVLLAIFPAIGAFVSLYGLVADPGTIGEHLQVLSGFMPGGALEIIGEQVQRISSGGDKALGFAFFSGLALSLWSANAGMKAIFDALNIAYEEEEKRNFFWLNLWSLGFTLATIVFLAVALSAVVVIPAVLQMVGLGPVTEWLIWVGRWPALLLVTLLGLAVLYRYGPSRDRAQWRWLTPGALLASVGWLVGSMLFSWYVSEFGNYNKTYGSLGAAIGFMTWIWLSTTIVLVGAELNSEMEHQTARDTTEGPERALGQRGATVADSVGEARS